MVYAPAILLFYLVTGLAQCAQITPREDDILAFFMQALLAFIGLV